MRANERRCGFTDVRRAADGSYFCTVCSKVMREDYESIIMQLPAAQRKHLFSANAESPVHSENGYVAQYAGNAKPLAVEKKRKRG